MTLQKLKQLALISALMTISGLSLAAAPVVLKPHHHQAVSTSVHRHHPKKVVAKSPKVRHRAALAKASHAHRAKTPKASVAGRHHRAVQAKGTRRPLASTKAHHRALR